MGRTCHLDNLNPSAEHLANAFAGLLFCDKERRAAVLTGHCIRGRYTVATNSGEKARFYGCHPDVPRGNVGDSLVQQL